MKRVQVYLKGEVEREVDYFVLKYGVSAAYVLQLAFKLTDRRGLENLLQLRLDASE